MSSLLETYRKHIEHCLCMAEAATDARERDWFLRVAAQFKVEMRLMLSAQSSISESRALLESATASLTRRPTFVQALESVRPSPAIDEQDQGT